MSVNNKNFVKRLVRGLIVMLLILIGLTIASEYMSRKRRSLPPFSVKFEGQDVYLDNDLNKR